MDPDTTLTPATIDSLLDPGLHVYLEHTGKNLRDYQQAANDSWASPMLSAQKLQDLSVKFDEYSKEDPRLNDSLGPISFQLHAIGNTIARGAGATLVSLTQFSVRCPITHVLQRLLLGISPRKKYVLNGIGFLLSVRLTLALSRKLLISPHLADGRG